MIILNETEIAHMKTGNRVFVVRPVDKLKSDHKTPALWNVAILKDNEVVGFIPEQNEGYESFELTKDLAECFVLLSEDDPIVSVHYQM